MNFLVAQLVKNLPAMMEKWVRSLSSEDSLKKGMATHSSILAWRIPMDRRAWWTTLHGVTRVRHDRLSTHNLLQGKFNNYSKTFFQLPLLFQFVTSYLLQILVQLWFLASNAWENHLSQKSRVRTKCVELEFKNLYCNCQLH